MAHVPALQAWLADAMRAAERGEEVPAAPQDLAPRDAEVPAPRRPMPAWTDREFESLLAAQLSPSVPAQVHAWTEAVRRVVGLHRRNPFAAARKRTSDPLAACRLLSRWSAVLAIAAWRTSDLPTLDALLTVLDALERPLARVLGRGLHPHDLELVTLSRSVARSRLRDIEEAS